MKLFWAALLDFFFPFRCLFCGKIVRQLAEAQICPGCFSQLIFFSSPKCPRCGIGFFAEEGNDHLCSKCLTAEESFSQARALGPYTGLLAEVITRFKYHGATYLAKPLGKLLAAYQDPDFSWSNIDLLIPVPLHPRRLRERGFNQSLLLARIISQMRKIPLDFTTLRRIRYTQPQTQVSGAERQSNIRGAFQVKTNKPLSGKNILLVDDVFTSGNTVEECARVLIKAGAKQVNVLTLARAL